MFYICIRDEEEKIDEKKTDLTLAFAMAMGMSLTACSSSSDKTDTSKDAAQETNKASKTENTETTKTEEAEEPEEPEEEAEWTFADGKFTCQTFSIDIPSGWTSDEQYATATSIRVYSVENPSDFSQFSDGKFDLSLSEFKHTTEDPAEGLQKAVNNDKQFFKDKEPEVTEDSFDGYSGFKLTGESFSFTNSQCEYLILDKWEEGTDNRSRLHLVMQFYDDVQKEAEDSILNSIQFLNAPEA